jgi:drug/metabolite transporter (DMT)-like permease
MSIETSFAFLAIVFAFMKCNDHLSTQNKTVKRRANTMGDKVEQDLNGYNSIRNRNNDEANSQTTLLSQQPQNGYYESLSVVDNGDSAHSTTTSEVVPNNGNVIGRAQLITVAFLYGTLNVILRLLYSLPGPPSASALSCSRGWLAVICFVPFLAKQNSDQKRIQSQENAALISQGQQPRVQLATSNNINRSRAFWRMAMELAVLNFLSQGLCNLGLLSIPSARAAFLTQTSVVITPVVSFLVGNNVHPKVWLACLVALGGLVLMSDPDGEGLGHFQVGDLLCLAGALCWSLYISRLSYCEAFDEIEMQAVKTFFLAVLYTGWFVAAFINSEACLWEGVTSVFAWALLFYSALGPGTLGDVLQQKGQGKVTAAEANVILSMEPVFTAVLGRLFLGEVTSMQDRFGGGLIIVAALIATT